MSEAEVSSDHAADETEPGIPDDFFEDFENLEFLEELVENVHHANAPSVHSDFREESSVEDGRSSSPIVKRCLKQIDKLTQDIRRRKRRLEKEMSGKDLTSRDVETEAPTSSTDIDTPSSSRRRSRRSRSPRSSNGRPRPKSRTRSTSTRTSTTHRIIRRSRSRERRRPVPSKVRRSRSRGRRPIRRSRSPSGRTRSPPRKRNRSAGSPTTAHNNHSSKSGISFLEELEQTFAKQGKDFPEKDLLLHSNSQPQNNNRPENWVQPQMQMVKVPLLQSPRMYPEPQHQGYYPEFSNYPNHMNPMNQHHMQPNHMNPIPMNPNIMNAMQHQPSFRGYNNTRYAMQQPPLRSVDPAKTVTIILDSPPRPLSPVSIPAQAPAPMDISPTTASEINSFGPPSGSNRSNALKRCKTAIKIISADENKMTKTKFLSNRTSPNGITEIPSDTATPLKCIKNVTFKFHSRSHDINLALPSTNGPKLDPRTAAVVRVLGFSCDQLIEALRMKSMANRVITKIQEKLPPAAKFAQTRNIYVQTTPMVCDKCVERENRVLLHQAVQTEAPKMVSIKIQTNKETYTEPLMNTLKSMNSAQLVAMTDFAHILCDQAPSNSAEIFKLREQMMDVYNLSKRDDEAVRAAERERLNSVRDLLSNSRRQERDIDLRSQGGSNNNSMDEYEFHRAQQQAIEDTSMQESMVREAEIELQRVERNEREFRMRADIDTQMGTNEYDMRGGGGGGSRPPGRYQRATRGTFPWRGRGGNSGFNPHVWHP